jgi:hypothetical protein
VHGENLLVDDSGDGETVKAVCKGFPQLDVVPPFAFIVESVYTIDGGAFMVPAQDEKVLGILDLVG